MANWQEVTDQAPEIAALAQARIEATGLGLVATLRRDGSPRISGVEPWFSGGDLWLGMMPRSLKARDLQRDPRLSLHNATVDKEVHEGDVKVTGQAVEVVDEAAKTAVREDFMARTGFDPGADFHLFRVDVLEVATIMPGGEYLEIQSWRVGEPPKRVERR
jgi:nitroimidazol reductase NimA-like FMN-containing flavoprotein (pyridoxamine 5'-phosphate oxidase superfamily)